MLRTFTTFWERSLAYLSRCQSLILICGFLFGLTFALHSPLIQNGLSYMDADDATITFTTDEFIQGDWSIFYNQQKYGGTPLTYLRAAWVFALQKLDLHWGEASGHTIPTVSSHLTFSFGVVPGLLSVSIALLIYSLTRSRRSTLVIGLLASVGLKFWVLETLERDFYSAYLILGILLLAWRARWDTLWPQDEKSPSALRRPHWIELFLFATVGGFSLYVCRASALFLVASLWPDRGRWKSSLQFRYWPFYLTLGGGVACGMTPEWVSLYLNEQESPILFHHFAQGHEMLKALLRLPVYALNCVGVDDIGKASWKSLPSFLLFSWSIYQLFPTPKNLARWGEEKLLALRPAKILLLLNCVAFLVVNQTAVGAARYLLPVTPVLFASLSIWIQIFAENTMNKPTPLGKYFKWGLATLALLHFSTQLTQRYKDAYSESSLKKISDELDVVQTFQKLQNEKGIRLVMSDDYWEGNQYSFLSRYQPYFISTGRVLGPELPHQIYPDQTQAGVILTQFADESTSQAELKGIHWKLQWIKKIGHRNLYWATRELP